MPRVAILVVAISSSTGCGAGSPYWVEHAEKASAALSTNNIAEADRETAVVLAEADKYGGKSPPGAELMARIFPMQDIGEHLSSIRLSVLPEWSSSVEDGWSDQQDVYANMQNEDQVAQMLARRIECMKANKHERNNERIGKLYKKYSEVLEKLGRAVQAADAKRQANEFNPGYDATWR